MLTYTRRTSCVPGLVPRPHCSSTPRLLDSSRPQPLRHARMILFFLTSTVSRCCIYFYIFRDVSAQTTTWSWEFLTGPLLRNILLIFFILSFFFFFFQSRPSNRSKIRDFTSQFIVHEMLHGCKELQDCFIKTLLLEVSTRLFIIILFIIINWFLLYFNLIFLFIFNLFIYIFTVCTWI